jgi:iron complex transport system substrate-binding protein
LLSLAKHRSTVKDRRNRGWRACAVRVSMVASIASPFAGCDRPAPDPDSAAIAATDDSGRTVELAAPATRIVSLIPAMTDVILSFGEADRLVARTRFDTDPRIAALPSLEDALTPSVEWLVSRAPDLVIAWPDRQSRTVVTRLAEIGIPVYTSRIETLDDMRRGIRNIGVLLGEESAADSLIGALDGAIAESRAAVADRDPLDVLYLIGLDPPMSVGPGSFLHEMIEIAGGRNILADATAAWPPVSVEEIVARDPDVLLIAVAAPADQVLARLADTPGLRQLEAVRQDRVRVLDPSLFNRPGPGLIDGMRILTRAIHPGSL